MTFTLRAAILSTALVALPGLVMAEPRLFSKAERYEMEKKGDTDIVITSDQAFAEIQTQSAADFGLELRVIHGVTAHWDVSLNHQFEQTTGDGTTANPATGLRLTTMGARIRYFVGERGKMPIDAVIAAGVRKDFGKSLWTVQPWLTLSKELGKLTVAIDPFADITFGSDQLGATVDAGWAGGLSYKAHKKVRLGAETWGGFNIRDTNNTFKWWLGPTLAWMPTKHMSFVGTTGFGLSPESDALTISGTFSLRL
jgi:hypothetical protein